MSEGDDLYVNPRILAQFSLDPFGTVTHILEQVAQRDGLPQNIRFHPSNWFMLFRHMVEHKLTTHQDMYQRVYGVEFLSYKSVPRDEVHVSTWDGPIKIIKGLA